MSKCLCYDVVNNPFESHAFLSLKTFIFHFYLDAGKGFVLLAVVKTAYMICSFLLYIKKKRTGDYIEYSSDCKKYSLFYSL